MVAALVVVVLAVGLWAFEPWRLVTSSTVDEGVPGASGDVSIRDVADIGTPSPTPSVVPSTTPSTTPSAEPPTTPSAEPSSTPTSTPAPAPAEPQLQILVEGAFEDAEHDTSGEAFVIETADGDRILRFEGLATSDGPDLFVGLSDAPSGGSWGSYDDSRYVQLGRLKATHGNQNYAIPDDVDLDGLTTAVVWCDRFNVAFGTAALAAA